MDDPDCILRIADNLPAARLASILLSTDGKGQDTLVAAIKSGNADVVDALLVAANLANVAPEQYMDRVYAGDLNPFLMAVNTGNVPVVEALYNYYANELQVRTLNFSRFY